MWWGKAVDAIGAAQWERPNTPGTAKYSACTVLCVKGGCRARGESRFPPTPSRFGWILDFFLFSLPLFFFPFPNSSVPDRTSRDHHRPESKGTTVQRRRGVPVDEGVAHVLSLPAEIELFMYALPIRPVFFSFPRLLLLGSACLRQAGKTCGGVWDLEECLPSFPVFVALPLFFPSVGLACLDVFFELA